jgi:sugar (glycoside-pentoside-hexuronide) transporter
MANGPGPLLVRNKLGFALGDHTINLSLSALSLFYLFFLTQVVGLRPTLASAVLLLGRAVDAFTDPAMGRISDRTRWGWGRRRPYFVIGAIPFGLSFAALWMQVPFESTLAKFAYYAAAYIAYSLSSTVLAVPYMALLPEMALGYQERTSISTYRAAFSVLGSLVSAALILPMTEWFGGGGVGFQYTGLVLAIWLTVPWAVVYLATWERPAFRREEHLHFLDGLKVLVRNGTYRRLVALYLCGRIAVDVVGAMLLFYFTYWLRRPGDFPIMVALLLVTVVFSLPLWLRISRTVDKHTVFVFGCVWWIGAQFALLAAAPGWPREIIFVVAVLAGFGYAVADLMPWAMIGEVVDQDELMTGERREGIYTGFLTFLRKLGGAAGVAMAAVALEFAGFDGQGEPPESALRAIRVVTSMGPALFLALAAWAAFAYPLGRVAHARIVEELEARRGSFGQGPGQ